MKKIVCLLITMFAISSNASVITFEAGLDPLFTYSGVNVSDTPVAANSGYNTVAAHTGSINVAFNPNEITPSTFTWAGAGTFDLTSFVIAGAWGSQTLTIEGLLNSVVTNTAQLAVDWDVANVFSPGWSGIDAFRITTGSDFVQNNSLTGSGQHWALDNLTINENVAVPEPATLALLGLGLVGLSMRKRKVS